MTQSKQGRTMSGIKNSFLQQWRFTFLAETIISLWLWMLGGGGLLRWRGREGGMRGAVVGTALSRKKDSLLSVNGASLLARTDIAANLKFVFLPETTMLYLRAWYKLGLVRDAPFSPCPSPAAHMGHNVCSKRSQWHRVTGGDKKPKDASPWLWTAPRNSLTARFLCILHRCPLTCTRLTLYQYRGVRMGVWGGAAVPDHTTVKRQFKVIF